MTRPWQQWGKCWDFINNGFLKTAFIYSLKVSFKKGGRVASDKLHGFPSADAH